MSIETATLFAILMVGITTANLLCFGLTLKLYTEYFKDVSQRSRRAGDPER